MKNCIRILLAVGLMLSVTVFGGCQTGGSTTQPADFNQTIIQNAGLIRAVTGTATTVALLNVSSTERTPLAREMYAVAASVNSQANAGQVNAAQVSQLVNSLLGSYDDKTKLIIGAVLNTSLSLVNSYIQQHSTDWDSNQQLTAFKTLIVASSAGVMDATLVYTQGTPQLANNAILTLEARSRLPGDIEIKHYQFLKK